MRTFLELDGQLGHWELRCLCRTRAEICRKPDIDLGTARAVDASAVIINKHDIR